MSLPGEILRTEFRLVVTYQGWEYTVLERELGAHRDPLRKMLVTVSGNPARERQPPRCKCSMSCLMPCHVHCREGPSSGAETALVHRAAVVCRGVFCAVCQSAS
jgi:hypothetical protein